MSDVVITGLTLAAVKKAHHNKNVLAFFDCQVGGFDFRGCALIKGGKFGMTMWPPRMDGPDGQRRGVHITDVILRDTITRKAAEAYKALGGTVCLTQPDDRDFTGFARRLENTAQN